MVPLLKMVPLSVRPPRKQPLTGGSSGTSGVPDAQLTASINPPLVSEPPPVTATSESPPPAQRLALARVRLDPAAIREAPVIVSFVAGAPTHGARSPTCSS